METLPPAHPVKPCGLVLFISGHQHLLGAIIMAEQTIGSEVICNLCLPPSHILSSEKTHLSKLYCTFHTVDIHKENAACHSPKPICLHSHHFSYLNPTSLTVALPTTFLALFPH